MSTVSPHLGPVEGPVEPRVHSCNRLGRRATPLSRGWALADWLRRAMRRYGLR